MIIHFSKSINIENIQIALLDIVIVNTSLHMSSMKRNNKYEDVLFFKDLTIIYKCDS